MLYLILILLAIGLFVGLPVIMPVIEFAYNAIMQLATILG